MKKIAIVFSSLLVFASNFVFATEEKLISEQPRVEHCALNRDASDLSPAPTITSEYKNIFAGKHPHLILVLSGGAYKSVAEIGVLRSLEKHHIKIDGVIGTSMGATIGALYCAGKSPDDIEKLFLDNTMQSVMMKGVRLGIVTKLFAPLAYIFKGRPYPGITDGKGYLEFLEKELPSSFEELKIPFASVVTNLTDGQTTVLTHGDLPQSVLASNCIPTIYRPVMINNKLYVDGGLKANLASNIAQNLGADVVVGVLVDTAIAPVENKKFKSKKALVIRVVDIMMASSDKTLTKSSDILIYPDVDFVPMITKDPEILKQGVDAGEKAADSVATRIKAELAQSQKHKTIAKKNHK